VVLATKYSFNMRPGDPNAGGNGRKNLLRALDGSLKRLQTDYVDLYWMHAWDQLTPVEEVVATMEALIRQGKIRHYAFSDVPAWYLGRAQAIAEVRGWERPIALQLEYSLVERFIEREHVPAALDLGLSVCPWSPLAEGLLTGKYTRNSGEGRLRKVRGQERLTERNFRIVETLLAVAKEVGRSPAQVAINWITRRPGVTSTILGATRLEQLEDNLQALEFDLPPGLSRRLEEVSAPERPRLYTFFTPEFAARLSGGAPVSAEPPWFRP
jgi:aryl-alcohol dehydrogenase-like predicted oxidoreductase